MIRWVERDCSRSPGVFARSAVDCGNLGFGFLRERNFEG